MLKFDTGAVVGAGLYNISQGSSVLYTNQSTIQTMARRSFAYLDEVLVDCRLRGLYNLCRQKKYARAARGIRDMLWQLNHVPVGKIAMDRELYGKVVDAFYRMQVDLVMGEVNRVHDRVRDLHYVILAGWV